MQENNAVHFTQFTKNSYINFYVIKSFLILLLQLYFWKLNCLKNRMYFFITYFEKEPLGAVL